MARLHATWVLLLLVSVSPQPTIFKIFRKLDRLNPAGPEFHPGLVIVRPPRPLLWRPVRLQEILAPYLARLLPYNYPARPTHTFTFDFHPEERLSRSNMKNNSDLGT